MTIAGVASAPAEEGGDGGVAAKEPCESDGTSDLVCDDSSTMKGPEAAAVDEGAAAVDNNVPSPTGGAGRSDYWDEGDSGAPNSKNADAGQTAQSPGLGSSAERAADHSNIKAGVGQNPAESTPAAQSNLETTREHEMNEAAGQAANVNEGHRDETLEDVSDISSDEASVDIDNGWTDSGHPASHTGEDYGGLDPSAQAHNMTRNRSFTIASVISNTSERESIRSQRENVDRLLMGGPGSLGRGGGGSSLGGSDRSPGGTRGRPECMQRPGNYAYTYDRNYYKSGSDWLRFFPRRSSTEVDRRSSAEGSHSASTPSFEDGGWPNHGYAYNNAGLLGSAGGNGANPDLYYRGFDNTRIRTGFHGRHPMSRMRNYPLHPQAAAGVQHFNQPAPAGSFVGPNGEIVGPNGEILNAPSAMASMSYQQAMAAGYGAYGAQCPPTMSHHGGMYPNVISVPIDEEEGGGENGNEGEISRPQSTSPPLEIHCSPTEEFDDNNAGEQVVHSYSGKDLPQALHELNPKAQEEVVRAPSPWNGSQEVVAVDPRVALDPRASSSLGGPSPSPPLPTPESGMQFGSSLRVGGIVRPKDDDPVPYVHPQSLPPHLREVKMHEASWDSKYETYACRVDQSQEDRSVEIPLFSLARPHMRAFHYAWLTFFMAFLAWFAITPLLGEVQETLDLTKEQIWTSSICSVAGAVVTRCFTGLFCDIYGARWVSAAVLVICGIPTIFTGAVNTAAGLSVLRLVTGIGGSAFVTCQYWTSSFFTREVAGTANALAAGWGNLGGGVAQIFVGSMLFPFFKWIYTAAETAKDPAELSWRTCCIIPGLMCTAFALPVLRYSDDSPKGNYHKRKKMRLMQKQSAMRHIKAAIHDHNTWLLLIQYGCCFGVELTTSNAAALYFKEEFELSTEAAAAVASTFGWMNLFARGLGGFLSDISNAYRGMRGRLWWQMVCFLLEGVFVMVFSRAKSLAGAITALMTFSLFVQGAEGSTFGIVPYLNPNVTGTVAGIVGAGGNAGAVIFSILFRQMEYRQAFFWMGAATSAISLLSCMVWIKGYEGMFFKRRVIPFLQPIPIPKPQNTSVQQASENAQNLSQPSHIETDPPSSFQRDG